MSSIAEIEPYRQRLKRPQPIALHAAAAPALQCLMAIMVVIAAFFASFAAARANPSSSPTPVIVNPFEARAGSLLLKGEGDRYANAPRLGTDIDIVVSGPTLRAKVTQIFHNPTSNWVEAIYVYPLPHGGAVDTLKMVIGDRIVIGDIKERQQARVIYEQAKQAGQKAALIEQERPNIFTNSVANIGPGETVLVQIEYQEPVRQSGNEFSLRMPLVVGPRYNPAPLVQSVDLRDGGWGQSFNDPVPDRDRITPPVLDPAKHAPVNPVTISVRLQAGFPLGEVKSHHHAVHFEAIGDDTRVIRLAEGAVPADRDFELTWKTASNTAPSVGLFRERVGSIEYLLAFVTPPAIEQAEQTQLPREVIFVIDNSGSMGGISIVQAKASLIYALGRLKTGDRFNVIRFDDTMDVLFSDAVPADQNNIDRARSFVDALQARGGTEMIPPMRAALNDKLNDAGFVRQVVFITDGMIGNEQQLFDTIASMRGRSRIFMVGIGSAPNNFLMNRAAELGRGTYTQIGSVDQVDERMRGLFAKLESPVVTGLTVNFSASKADMTPAAIPDIYRGEPLVLAAKLDKLDGDLEIKGRVGDRPWVVTLPIAKAAEGKGLSKVWARRKIADAEVARTMRQVTPEEGDKRILALGLEHQLVTRLTSLVAVDKTPSRPEGESLRVAELPLNLPAGWEFEKVFGPNPLLRKAQTDTGNSTKLAQNDASADVLSKSAPKPPATASGRQLVRVPQGGMQLPKTATDAELRMMSGLAMLVLSLILFFLNRRRRWAHG
jgi:Ca-activated chloride channel homolog